MESKKINQLATELTPALSDLTIIGDPTTGISKKITLSQMASLFTGTVEEYPDVASFPLVGVADTIYIALDTNVLYRWDTTLTSYVELSPNIINSLVFSDANGFDGTISLVGSVATLTITTALTTGSVAFIGASGALVQDNANFYWDDTNNRLGIGTNAPTTAIDAFGSGIIGRLNGTSTNNSFLGFASAGTNKWSIGNVQSDHRFRIYSEANTSELVSVLQTGEVGIGIANPTTKLHIDGGASALIANLDANVSVAKSISFRSDNSNRINIEVSGTESGSNTGADLFIKRYSDAGALIDTPLTITRSTGIITLTNLTVSNAINAIGAVFTGSIYTTAGNGISAGGATYAISPSSTRGVININGSTDQFLTLGSNGYLNGSSTLVRLQSTPNLDFVVGGSQRLIINASTGVSTFNNDIYSITGTGLLIGGGSYAIGPTSTRGIIALNGSGDQILTFSSQSYLYNSSSLFRLLSSNDLDIVLGGTQRMIIKAATGNIGIGTTTPFSQGTGARSLEIAGDTFGQLYVYGGGGAPARGGFMGRGGGFGDVYLAAITNSPLVFGVNDSEKMRLTALGYFKYSDNGTYNNVGGIYNEFRQSANSAGLAIRCYNASFTDTILSVESDRNTTNGTYSAITYYNYGTGAIRFRVADSGNVTNTNNSYGAISDIKLKENVIDATDKLEKLLKVRIVNYNLINDEQKQIGVIAQELEQIFPSMIEQTEDFEEIEIEDGEGNITKEKKSLGTYTKSVKYSVFVPMLIKAVQELNAKIK